MVRTLSTLVVLAGLLAVLWFVWPSEAVTELQVRGRAATISEPHRGDGRPGDGAAHCAPVGNALRVLFVGNSHTTLNGVPAMIAALARSARRARPLDPVVEARGGAKLQDHLRGGRVSAHLRNGRWDHVVLQEQQQLPSYTRNPKWLEGFLAPARTLDVLSRAAGASTILYMTWAGRDGNVPVVPGDSYEAMQRRVNEGYRTLAREIGAEVAPVGVAWASAHRERPALPLWAKDGHHASKAGSYLAACVLYRVLYGAPATGIAYTAGLPGEGAAFLQRAADAAPQR